MIMPWIHLNISTRKGKWLANKQERIKDPDLARVGIALKRAAAKARQLGFDTNTPVYVYREGKIVDIVAEHRASQSPKKAIPKKSRTIKKRTPTPSRRVKNRK